MVLPTRRPTTCPWSYLGLTAFALLTLSGCVRAGIGQRGATGGDASVDSAPTADLGVASDATPGSLQSSHVRGGPGIDRVRAAVLDAQGNLYLAGSFRGTVRLADSDLASRGAADAFIASFDASGNARWAFALGSDESDEATGLAIDEAGQLTVVGVVGGSFDYSAQSYVGKGGDDAFVAALDASTGSPRWGKLLGSLGDDRATSVSVSPSGDVSVGGSFTGAVDFGNGTLAGPVATTSGFIARYSQDGGARWAQRLGGDGDVRVMGIADAGANRLYLAGTYEGDLIPPNLPTVANAGATDIFISAVASSDGRFEWVQRLGGPAIDGALALAATEEGPVATGRFSGQVSFGGNPATAAGLDDVFVARFNAGGGLVWSHTFGSGGVDNGRALTIGLGRVYLSGAFSGSIFPIGAGTKLSSAGGEDLFVSSYRYADGAVRWARRFGGPGLDSSDAIALRGRRLVVAGAYSDQVDFGDGLHASEGATDLFWLELAP